MEKMLFEFDYKGDTVYCIVDFFDSIVENCKTVHIEFLCKDYVHTTSLILSVDSIEDIHFLSSLIFQRVANCISSYFNQIVIFKGNWNRYCDSVPQVYQFEKETLFKDSKISKFNNLKSK